MARLNYEMSQKEMDTLLAAMQPMPLIMLQCGTPKGIQERANDAWKVLGDKFGFDHMTVQPNGSNPLFFSAEQKPVAHNG